MLNICSVCGQAVPGGKDACPACGADGPALRRMRPELSAGDMLFRVHEAPFEATRAWASACFGDLLDPEGRPVYKYFPLEGSLFRVEEGPDRYQILTAVAPDGTVNRPLLDGEPLEAVPVPLDPGRRYALEIWSRASGGPVARFELSFA